MAKYQESIAACEEEIEKLVVAFEPRVDPVEHPLPPGRKEKQRKRKKKSINPKTGFDTRTEAYKLFGGVWLSFWTNLRKSDRTRCRRLSKTREGRCPKW